LFRRAAEDNGTVTAFQFAHVLEQLESKFYSTALQTFQASDFSAAGFTSPSLVVQQLNSISSDENTHVTALETALTSFGVSPIEGCQFNFGDALTDVNTMAAVARVVENAGVSAYAGALELIGDPALIATAASIMSIEARHQTVLNILSGTGSAIPQPFDIPLNPSEVLAMAGPFISNCSLGITANPPLTITNNGTITNGTQLTFSSPALNSSTSGLSCQMLVGGAPESLVFPFNACVVPPNVNGPVAVYITSDGNPLNGNVQQRQSQTVLAGPQYLFVDSEPELLGQLVRSVNGTSGTPPPPVTQTLTSSGAPTGTPAPKSVNNESSTGNAVIVNGISMVPAPNATPSAAPSGASSAAPSAAPTGAPGPY
jgi:hypothetical protein